MGLISRQQAAFNPYGKDGQKSMRNTAMASADPLDITNRRKSGGKYVAATLDPADASGFRKSGGKNLFGKKIDYKGARGMATSALDPLDITGMRKGQQEKEFAEQQAAEEARRQAENKSLIKRGKKLKVEKVKKIKAGQIMPKLEPGLQTAEGDVGYLRGMARTEGPTKIAQTEEEKQKLEEQGQLEGLASQQNTATAQGFSDLASQGGAEVGARERLASTLGSQNLRAQQDIRRQGALSRLGITSGDEERKLALAKDLPGAQLAVGQERRAGLTQDVGAKFNAAERNQAMAQQSNIEQFGHLKNLYGLEAGMLGSEQLMRQQQAAAATKRKGGPFGSGSGFMGLPSPTEAGGTFGIG